MSKHIGYVCKVLLVLDMTEKEAEHPMVRAEAYEQLRNFVNHFGFDKAMQHYDFSLKVEKVDLGE